MKSDTVKLDPEILLDAIVLRTSSNNENHKKLIDDLIKLSEKDTSNTVGIPESTDATSQLYLDILKTIHTNLIDIQDKQTLLLTLLKFEASPVVKREPAILNNIRDLLSLSTKTTPKKIDNLVTKISTSINLTVAEGFIRRMNGKLSGAYSTNDPLIRENYLSEILNSGRSLVTTLENNQNSLNNVVDRYLESVNMDNKEDIRKAVKQYNKRSKHVFKTGLQGLNRMFGKLGGFKLGESITINALKHNYKSGLLMSFAKWIVTHNHPYEDKEHPGAPTILFITLENEANENIMWWFTSMYVHAHGGPPARADMSDDEIVEAVYEFFHKSGYKFIIERKLGADFGYEEYVQMYERYQKTGHRILVTIIDYMNMMKKTTASDKSRSDLQLRDLYNKMCNFNKNHMTTQISAHQLNRDAARLAVGTTNVVKKFNDSHYADGMDVGREVDMEIFIHIERNNSGKAYLTMARGKHRYVNDTPEKDKYCAYAFNEYGIPDDIDTEDMSVRNIYAEDASVDDMLAAIKNDALISSTDTSNISIIPDEIIAEATTESNNVKVNSKEF